MLMMMFRIRLYRCLMMLLPLTGSALGQDMEAISEHVRPRVEALRSLDFLHAVTQTYQSVEELQQMLQQELARTYPGDTLDVLEKRLLKFGFVASSFDLRTQLLRMYSQQIAGYYDPREKRLVLIEHSPGMKASNGMFPIEMLSQWVVASAGLSLEEILLAHELTHAVQDQHFDLLSLPIEALDPEDTTSALKALIEGDATLVMFDYMLAPQGLNVLDTPELSANLHTWVESPLVRGINMFQPIPRYVIDNLLFSYVSGFDFVVELKRRRGWEGVNQAYRDFPVSTEQILHPEKYLDHRDLPTLITLPDLPDRFGAWRGIERNTLGEFNIRLLLDGYLSSSDALTASGGWDGDRFALYEQADSHNLLVVWYTAWDSEIDSQEFFHNYSRMLEKRYSSDAPDSDSIPTLPIPNIQQWSTAGGEVLLERRDRDVLFVDAVAAEDLEFVQEYFWNSQVERRE